MQDARLIQLLEECVRIGEHASTPEMTLLAVQIDREVAAAHAEELRHLLTEHGFLAEGGHHLTLSIGPTSRTIGEALGLDAVGLIQLLLAISFLEDASRDEFLLVEPRSHDLQNARNHLPDVQPVPMPRFRKISDLGEVLSPNDLFLN